MKTYLKLCLIAVSCSLCSAKANPTLNGDNWYAGGGDDDADQNVAISSQPQRKPMVLRDWILDQAKNPAKMNGIPQTGAGNVADDPNDEDKDTEILNGDDSGKSDVDEVRVANNDEDPDDDDSDHSFEHSKVETLKAVNATNIFGAKFYNVLSKVYPNFVFSPLTISIMMALITRGADGNTLAELFEAMGYQQSGLPRITDVQNGFHGLSHEYIADRNETKAEGFRSEVATSMWINDGKKINTLYLDDAAKSFHTKLRGINFRLGSDRTQSIINKWVNKRSSGRGMSCEVRKVPFAPDTQLVFLNTIYFSAYFGSEFQFALETVANFYSFGTNKIRAKFLQATTVVPFYHSQRLRASLVEIPFRTGANKKHSLVVVLPDVGSNIQELEAEMEKVTLLFDEIALMKKKLLNVMIPKNFAQDSLRLDRLLQILGVKSVFHPDSAELTYISAYERLSIDRIFHEAVFEFKQLSMAGAEDIELGRTQQEANLNKDWHDGDIKQFYANRPFMFMIVEKTLNTAMFLGRVSSV